jgi:hypothetical protein
VSLCKRAVVILGAGASHDLMSPADEAQNARAQYKPPLTEDIFSIQPSFQEILDHYPDASALAETIRVKPQDKALEALLREFSESPIPQRAAQFREVPLYLQELFGVISTKYTERQPRNCAHLVNHMLSEFGRVAFITLNYDLFLEKALGVPSLGGPIDTLDAYIRPDRLVVKLHGSVNWARRIQDWPVGVSRFVRGRSALDLSWVGERPLDEMLDPGIRLLPDAGHEHRWLDRQPYYPALVVPVEGKYGFVCPPDHVEGLKEFLRECQNILVIGCSGKDEDLLDLLRDSMSGCGTFFLVSMGGTEVEAARERFLVGVPQLRQAWRNTARFADGFSDFIAKQGVERFAQSCPT